jgi:hypothetical protein
VPVGPLLLYCLRHVLSLLPGLQQAASEGGNMTNSKPTC